MDCMKGLDQQKELIEDVVEEILNGARKPHDFNTDVCVWLQVTGITRKDSV